MFGGGDALGGAAAAAGARGGEAEELVEDAEQGSDSEEGSGELSARRRLTVPAEGESAGESAGESEEGSDARGVRAESLSSTLGGLISTHPVTVPGAWRTTTVRVKHFWCVEP